jgi:flagellar biosynthetic protein FliR
MLEALQHILNSIGIHTDLGTSVVLFGLLLARLVSAIVLSPFLGGQSVPGRAKMGLAILLSVLLFGSVVPQDVPGEMNVLRTMCLFLKEGLIGATLGFLSQIIFQSVQMAGAMIDYGRGMSQATFFAPQLESNVSLLGQMQFQATLVLFLIFNGHLYFVRALADSFQAVPLLDFPRFSGGTWPAMEQMAHYTSQSLAIALQLSAPALLALFLVDVGSGVIGKVASGIHVHNESQPVKALLGLGVVLLAVSYIMGRMPQYFVGMIEQIHQFMQHLS